MLVSKLKADAFVSVAASYPHQTNKPLHRDPTAAATKGNTCQREIQSDLRPSA